MYHGILFTECTSQNWLGRGYGVHRLANELRKYGFNILVVDFAFAVTIEMYKEILDNSVGPETYFVGFSTSIFPYRMQDVEGQKRASLLQHSYARESSATFLKLETGPWYWEKDDGTDIKNYNDAKLLAEECEQKLSTISRKRKWIFKHSPFGKEDLTVERIKSLSWDEYKQIPTVSGNMLLVKDQVMKDYFTPLLQFLRDMHADK